MKTKINTSGIKSWPEDDRPREKLLKKGAGALSNSELLAILLRTGVKGTSAIELARKILKKFGTFRNMVHTDTRDWKEFKGLGGAKIAHIQAALEIGRRLREVEAIANKKKIKAAADLVEILIPEMRDLKTEVFKVAYLDNQNMLIEITDVEKGTVDHATPIVREIMHGALQKFAVAIICAHNHPGGSITPSSQDRQFTRELVQAGQLMSVKVLDHIIIGLDEYFSFSDQKIL